MPDDMWWNYIKSLSSSDYVFTEQVFTTPSVVEDSQGEMMYQPQSMKQKQIELMQL